MTTIGLIITIASAVIAAAMAVYLLIWYRHTMPARIKEMHEEAKKDAEVIKQKKLMNQHGQHMQIIRNHQFNLWILMESNQ